VAVQNPARTGPDLREMLIRRAIEDRCRSRLKRDQSLISKRTYGFEARALEERDNWGHTQQTGSYSLDLISSGITARHSVVFA